MHTLGIDFVDVSIVSAYLSGIVTVLLVLRLAPGAFVERVYRWDLTNREKKFLKKHGVHIEKRNRNRP